MGRWLSLHEVINMFIVITEPKKFTKSYTEACKIADTHYNITGEIVAVEEVVNHV